MIRLDLFSDIRRNRGIFEDRVGNSHLQISCELYKHPIREHIETRYNAVRKTENDVFSEKDFTIKTENRCKLSLVF